MLFRYLPFTVEGDLSFLRERLKEDMNSQPMCNLCTRNTVGVVVVFFNLDPEIQFMISKIYNIQTSRIFNELWKKYQKLEYEKVTMTVIMESMWGPINDKLVSIKEKFVSGEIQIKKVEKYLKMFNYDYPQLEKEFELLVEFFVLEKAIIRSEKVHLRDRIQQVKHYQKLFDAGLAARSILELRRTMKLTGDFSEVESIAAVSC